MLCGTYRRGVLRCRFDLMQAVDALRWGPDTSSPVVRQQQEHAAALQAALRQPIGRPVSLEREVRRILCPYLQEG